MLTGVPPELVRALDRQTLRRIFGMGYRRGRTLVEALAHLNPIPRGVSLRKGRVADRPALLLVPEGASPHPRVIWFHGGAFCFLSPRVYAPFAAHLARALGASVCLPSYRLAPEHPYPAAHEDSLAAVRAIQARGEPVVVAGDSAGGGLALAAAAALRDAGEQAPAGMLLMSPWVDLTLSGESMRSNDGKDAILRASDLPRHVASYVGTLSPDDPRVSPLHGDLEGLPAALIQCGSDELFLSEGTELAQRITTAGGAADLEVFDGMWHDFQAHAGAMEEATRAVGSMANWARRLLA